MDEASLPRLFDQKAPLAPELAERHLRALLEALAELHDEGRKHGDLYVNHVRLRPDGRILLRGEGLEAGEELDRARHNPSMYAPESIRGEPTTPASDVWSVGVYAYWMLTGSLPFRAVGLPERLLEILRGEPAPLDPSLPPSLTAFTNRCLQRDPSDRFANAREALAAL